MFKKLYWATEVIKIMEEAFNRFRTIKTIIYVKGFFLFNVSFLIYRQKMKSPVFKIPLRMADFAANQEIHYLNENIRTFLKSTFLIWWILKKIWQFFSNTVKMSLVCVPNPCLQKNVCKTLSVLWVTLKNRVEKGGALCWINVFRVECVCV